MTTVLGVSASLRNARFGLGSHQQKQVRLSYRLQEIIIKSPPARIFDYVISLECL